MPGKNLIGACTNLSDSVLTPTTLGITWNVDGTGTSVVPASVVPPAGLTTVNTVSSGGSYSATRVKYMGQSGSPDPGTFWLTQIGCGCCPLRWGVVVSAADFPDGFPISIAWTATPSVGSPSSGTEASGIFISPNVLGSDTAISLLSITDGSQPCKLVKGGVLPNDNPIVTTLGLSGSSHCELAVGGPTPACNNSITYTGGGSSSVTFNTQSSIDPQPCVVTPDAYSWAIELTSGGSWTGSGADAGFSNVASLTMSATFDLS